MEMYHFVFYKHSFCSCKYTLLGVYLHLTRQHWISSLSLILPGNDDDIHLLTGTRQTTFGGVSSATLPLGPDQVKAHER